MLIPGSPGLAGACMEMEVIMNGPLPRSLIFHVRPSTGFRFIDMGELSNYRDLLFSMIARGNIKVKCKPTILGGL
ncbi:MAG: hypothetical protein M0C28_19955 [Candidatus Moduliflexus flocculans]|nr:hypothetical protein [Candidatus Moduliflexus flocculans]